MTIQPFMNVASAAASGASNNSSTKSNSASDTSAAYLQLLITELQAQDPTSPLDPNQMTAQIVSLNQLDQLIQIREILQGVSS
ncbi:MAG TPA: flagellar hook capping FlgD N-terminal domain-containing protein [Terriglobales bacterium]|nr:flagellar hook capping FlgD N-terminal domain-containing protein [Terriglobales bacterium]